MEMAVQTDRGGTDGVAAGRVLGLRAGQVACYQAKQQGKGRLLKQEDKTGLRNWWKVHVETPALGGKHGEGGLCSRHQKTWFGHALCGLQV